MNPLPNQKTSRTNWKYILIAVVLAVIVGGGILWFSIKQEVPAKFPEITKPEKVEEEITELNIPGSWYYPGGDTLKGYLIFHPNGILELPEGWFPEEKESPRWQYNPEKELLTISFKLTPNLFPENEVIAADFFRPLVGYDKENFSVSIQVTSETEAIVFFGWIFYKVEDETANWKTYRNEEYGFEIKYPKDYLVKEEKIIHGLEKEQPPEYIQGYRYGKPAWLLNTVEIYSPSFPSGGAKIEINIWNNANNLTVNQWLDYINEGVDQGLLYEGRFVDDRKSISILGIEVIKGTYGCCGRCIKGVFIPKEDKIYNLGLDGKDECNFVDEFIFNQMLSTFTLY